MLKGVNVVLHELQETGRDGFNAPVYTVKKTAVKNVLVTPGVGEDDTDNYSMYGKTIEYTLCIPKGDKHKWYDTQVEFFGEVWDTVGYPQEWIEDMLPLSWNKKVRVCRHG